MTSVIDVSDFRNLIKMNSNKDVFPTLLMFKKVFAILQTSTLKKKI